LLRFIALCTIALTIASVAAAQNVDAIAARQEIYKGFGKATKPVGAMLKGDTGFDLATAKQALATYSAGAKKLPALFPPDSKKGHDTEALPAIWDHKDDFEARFAKLAADSDAAAASITDEASFKATMPKLLGECGSCHKAYRQK
jgi:cytochrome c556